MINSNKLKSLIVNHKKIISVYGLGNVGGPLAAAWLRVGAKVIGVDISKQLLLKIENGTSHKKEPFLTEIFTKNLKKGTFSLTSNGTQASKNSDIKIVAVPVALKRNNIDLKIIRSVLLDISKGLKKGDCIMISPSLAPGTTEKILLPLIEKTSKLKHEKDFLLIYNPERIYEGRALKDIESNYPAIVAGIGGKSSQFGYNLLKIISKKGVLTLDNIATAEVEKLFEGVYRDVNIALANELADYCERIKINYWDAKKAANSQPFCHLHYPGTGVGGLCIPVYPKFIIESAKKMNKNMKLLEYSRKLNDFTPKKCVNDALNLLYAKRKKKKNQKIAILGLGFRGDVADSRLSPSFVVIKEFLKKGHSITVHDPYIIEEKKLPKSIILSKKLEIVTNNADLIFISTDHKQYKKLKKSSFKKAKKPLVIFDGRNVLNKNRFKNSLIKTIGNYINS